MVAGAAGCSRSWPSGELLRTALPRLRSSAARLHATCLHAVCLPSRFRERQKNKITTMEVQVEELAEQLKRATTENSSLRNLNNILEQVVWTIVGVMPE